MAKKVPPAVREALKGRLKTPQLSELAQHFFQIAGGPRSVANMLYTEYLAAPSGGQTRQRILDLILRVTKFANAKDAGAGDLGVLEEEDLEVLLEESLAGLSDASETTTPERPA